MDDCRENNLLNWLDRSNLTRIREQGLNVLARAQRRAVHWPSLVESLRGEGKPIHLDTAFRTMTEYMDYVSKQCGKFHVPVPEKVAVNHACRYHRKHLDWSRQKKHTFHKPRENYQGTRFATSAPGPSTSAPGPSTSAPGPSNLDRRISRSLSKDIMIEVCPGTYSVTMKSPNATTMHTVAVDSGEIIDLNFPR